MPGETVAALMGEGLQLSVLLSVGGPFSACLGHPTVFLTKVGHVVRMVGVAEWPVRCQWADTVAWLQT